ncbi:16S rRNA (cytidine(1402)-2'-O)-methyltransferase [uncultured Helicobacter sp.]|uniref:16S rRNA (cytidine(1402)-2'-O)-methyltransferase n=1 Tax=uncultured Helicobacter sp. TaxID=175537 RepID=UPI001C3B95E8|nr:16S rRNA (cytidine(1402)-2'-O)-methyltransferase [Candidatus Helicobacter avicola]
MLTLLPAPIGNLLDISLRSLQVLSQAQVVLCEDTRVAKKLYTLLLERSLFGTLLDSVSLSQKHFIALHSHNEEEVIATFDEKFFTQNVVYLSDAGMPTISDPGAKLVQWCITHDIPYDVLPGASALNVCFASSGIESQSFFFGGFLPHKQSQRQQILSRYAMLGVPCIWYESPHRISQSLQDIALILPNAYLCVCKELSKIHQTRFFGSAKEILHQLESTKICGEWVLCLIDNTRQEPSLSISEVKALDIAPKAKAKILSLMTQKSVKECYQELIQSQTTSDKVRL